ncbi:MAG: helix-turn-helix domain-containing protein [Clostridia bacterium]|jgi:transcriptional regulator with XRE-family HTH domain|nr:helix-turn-helix domain-containing protein [Clostridia bacterium]MBR0159015.1 helix-turn-helix domain-containing protein [Clostridia bacterium]MBR7061483.1 helix-turn-helix domain-containing protein [Clostridia bacterium]
MDIGKKISGYRRQSGLTQKQLADMLCVSEDLVSKWECGSRRPDYGTIRELADVLGVEIGKISDIDELILTELERCIPEGIDAGELPGHISAFLRKIPERDANIFIARYYYFEDVKRIAAEHGIRANNAGIILFRTRAKLTEFLKEEIHNE